MVLRSEGLGADAMLLQVWTFSGRKCEKKWGLLGNVSPNWAANSCKAGTGPVWLINQRLQVAQCRTHSRPCVNICANKLNGGRGPGKSTELDVGVLSSNPESASVTLS